MRASAWPGSSPGSVIDSAAQPCCSADQRLALRPSSVTGPWPMHPLMRDCSERWSGVNLARDLALRRRWRRVFLRVVVAVAALALAFGSVAVAAVAVAFVSVEVTASV